ncbi:MAG TPA: hypothetical protein VG820_12765 [Fimbriimonadaceae bacterium]|nr:hypothetical protein [Fimbriimonadaceae bacterium]
MTDGTWQLAARLLKWWPEEINKREALLLLQMAVGLCTISVIVSIDCVTSISGLSVSLADRGALGAIMAWAFAAVAAPLGVFGKKPWGHFLEIGVSIPLITLGVLLSKGLGHVHLPEIIAFAYIAFMAVVWLVDHFKAGLRLMRTESAT